MKKTIIIASTVLFFGFTAFAQNDSYSYIWNLSEYGIGTRLPQELNFEVHGRYNRSVTKEKLNGAKLLSDFIDGYPTNWITDYVSAEISATCNGKALKAVSPNDVLSKEQKNILNTVDLGTGIIINVKYKSLNYSVKDNIKNDEMHVSMMIVPEKEAEYIGGKQQLNKYLKETAINKITETTPVLLQQGIVIFTINEEGEIINAKIVKSSGDPKTDKLLMESIIKMPKWRPAENSKGVKVKQEFEFNVGNGGC